MKETMTFDNFLISESNQQAYQFAKSVAENGGILANPFMIYGPTSVGKTHLATAILQKMSSDPEKKVLCLSCEELEDAIKNFLACRDGRDYTEFFDPFENLDLMVVENVESLEGKYETQKAIARLIHYLCREKTKITQVVMTANKKLEKKNVLSNYLLLRAPKYTVCEILEPDRTLKEKYIRVISKNLGFEVSDTVMEVLCVQNSNLAVIGAVLREAKDYSVIFEKPLDDCLIARVWKTKLR